MHSVPEKVDFPKKSFLRTNSGAIIWIGAEELLGSTVVGVELSCAEVVNSGAIVEFGSWQSALALRLTIDGRRSRGRRGAVRGRWSFLLAASNGNKHHCES